MTVLFPPVILLLLTHATLPTADMPVALRSVLHQARLNQVLARWRCEVEKGGSLHVEFTLTRGHGGARVELPGTLKLLSEPGKSLSGSCKWSLLANQTGIDEFRLIDGTLYLLDHAAKSATSLPFPPTQQKQLLQRLWLPLLICLEPEALEPWAQVRVEKQDGWYSYIYLEAKRGGRRVLGFDRGRIVVMNRATEDLPVTIPHEFHWWDGGVNKVEIHRWRRNDPERVKAGDFTVPDLVEPRFNAVPSGVSGGTNKEPKR